MQSTEYIRAAISLFVEVSNPTAMQSIGLQVPAVLYEKEALALATFTPLTIEQARSLIIERGLVFVQDAGDLDILATACNPSHGLRF
jgi:hypothetical protein